MNHYETVFIMNPVLSEEQMRETVQKFTKLLKDGKGKDYCRGKLGPKKDGLQYPKEKDRFLLPDRIYYRH